MEGTNLQLNAWLQKEILTMINILIGKLKNAKVILHSNAKQMVFILMEGLSMDMLLLLLAGNLKEINTSNGV